MRRLVYTSIATIPMSDTDIGALMRRCQYHNAIHRLTGILLHKDMAFMQLIEGSEDAVDQLMCNIHQDPRHLSITMLTNERVTERQFGSRQMQYERIDDQTVKRVPEYSPFMDMALTDPHFREHPDQALELVSIFRQLSYRKFR